MPMTITTSIASAAQFTFAPVRVTSGRKFKGFGYIVDVENRPMRIAYRFCSIDTAKIWDPANKSFGYATYSLCSKVEMAEADILAAKAAYIEAQLMGTIDWCKSVKPNISENELMRFARNVVRKQNPALLAAFDAAIEVVDDRDVVMEIRKTIEWALTLRTRRCYMYGKWCEGGKMYAPRRYVDIARKALEKRGVTKLPDFEEMWRGILPIYQLPVK